jgi:hypothetical protein
LKKTIVLLGVEGCPTCARLDANVQAALAELEAEIGVEKVTDPERIMEYAAGGLPAVIVDGQVKSVRRVPEVEELKTWLA